MADFSERLRQLRTQKGISQQELADVIGVNKVTISGYERGIRRPAGEGAKEIYEKIADYFNVDTSFLIGISDVSIKLSNPLDSSFQNHPIHGFKIPVLGRVAAGIPISATEEIIDYEEIAEELANTGEYFGLLIKGDSMEPRIKERDVVIVRKQDDADDGDLVIALINGNDAVCKRLKKYKDGIALLSNNPKYDPLYFSNTEMESTPVKIIGKVKELRAKF